MIVDEAMCLRSQEELCKNGKELIMTVPSKQRSCCETKGHLLCISHILRQK